MEHESEWRLRISEICFDLYELSKTFSDMPKSPSYMSDEDENLIIDQPKSLFPTILSVDEAIRVHKSNGDKKLAWNSFKYHSAINVIARYWVGYYYYHHDDDIPELKSINPEERNAYAVHIFKETANKGNTSAQFRYGIHLWESEKHTKAIKYLEMSADAGDPDAMYNLWKAYWKGVNGIEPNKEKAADYLRLAASKNNPKAIEMLNNIDIV